MANPSLLTAPRHYSTSSRSGFVSVKYLRRVSASIPSGSRSAPSIGLAKPSSAADGDLTPWRRPMRVDNWRRAPERWFPHKSASSRAAGDQEISAPDLSALTRSPARSSPRNVVADVDILASRCLLPARWPGRLIASCGPNSDRGGWFRKYSPAGGRPDGAAIPAEDGAKSERNGSILSCSGGDGSAAGRHRDAGHRHGCGRPYLPGRR